MSLDLIQSCTCVINLIEYNKFVIRDFMYDLWFFTKQEKEKEKEKRTCMLSNYNW